MTAKRPHRLYKEILRSGFDTAFRKHDVELGPDDIERIANAPMTMRPHSDLPDALRRLRERYKLAIFTNSDDDLIAPTVERIGVPFDYAYPWPRGPSHRRSRPLCDTRAEGTLATACRPAPAPQ